MKNASPIFMEILHLSRLISTDDRALFSESTMEENINWNKTGLKNTKTETADHTGIDDIS